MSLNLSKAVSALAPSASEKTVPVKGQFLTVIRGGGATRRRRRTPSAPRGAAINPALFIGQSRVWII
jgi:hypothetical protein